MSLASVVEGWAKLLCTLPACTPEAAARALEIEGRLDVRGRLSIVEPAPHGLERLALAEQSGELFYIELRLGDAALTAGELAARFGPPTALPTSPGGRSELSYQVRGDRAACTVLAVYQGLDPTPEARPLSVTVRRDSST